MSEIIFCDSGISKDQNEYVQAYDIGYGIYDANGHGTSLISLVHKINKNIELESIKILDKNNEGSLEGLINALNKCLELDSRVICLALSIDNTITTNNELQEVVKKVRDSGKVIVAALHNEAMYSIPAGYQEVIGVKTRRISANQLQFYDVTQAIQCEIPLETFFCKSLDGNFVKFGGNSVACAFFAEHIASIIKTNEGYHLSDIEKIVAKQEIQDIKYYRYFDYISIHSEQEDNIRDTISKVNKKCNIYAPDGYILTRFRNLEHLNYYLKELEKNDLFINERTFLRRYDLQSVSTLTNYFMIQKSIN